MTTKTCTKCGNAYDLNSTHFPPHTSSPDGFRSQCRTCYAASVMASRARVAARKGEPIPVTKDEAAEVAAIPTGAIARDGHPYVPHAEMVSVFKAVVAHAEATGEHPMNLIFIGPSGSGKTEGAAFLADQLGLPFTKVDAAAMTDPESWFGTREVVVKDGVSVTAYRPSTFVEALGQPGVLLIDEVNRVRDEHRNILLPLTDGSYRVTNPLTGDVVVRHPQCYIIMSGNRGLAFTGTYPVDPALTTRAATVLFDYLAPDVETAIAVTATGVSTDYARLFVRFAAEVRNRAKVDPELMPVSTREVLMACRFVAAGLDPDTAAHVAIINGTSDEGDAASAAATLKAIWVGINPRP